MLFTMAATAAKNSKESPMQERQNRQLKCAVGCTSMAVLHFICTAILLCLTADPTVGTIVSPDQQQLVLKQPGCNYMQY